MPAVMGSPLRYMPYPNTVFEVTTLTIQGRIIPAHSREQNDIVLGILGRRWP